jgi:hypothetical protein
VLEQGQRTVAPPIEQSDLDLSVDAKLPTRHVGKPCDLRDLPGRLDTPSAPAHHDGVV